MHPEECLTVSPLSCIQDTHKINNMVTFTEYFNGSKYLFILTNELYSGHWTNPYTSKKILYKKTYVKL